MNLKFKRGDIITSDYGNTWIVAQVSDRTDSYYGFNAKKTYALLFERQDDFTKIGEFPMNTIGEAIETAKNQLIDLQTQVNIAVALMGEFLEADGKDTLLVLKDMRVDKDANTVLVQCSTGGSKPNTWKTVIEIYEEYGINKYGI